MQTWRRRLRPLTWLALAAMLGLGLLPAVSHALAWAGGSGSWATVCSARGLAAVAAGDGHGGQNGMPAAGAFEHCPYCAHAAGTFGLPPAPQAMLPAPRAGAAAPGGKRRVPVASAPWASAQPRGPPTQS
jgi:hypothetical protein